MKLIVHAHPPVCRIGAALKLKVEDLAPKSTAWVAG
jgi:hypothetical protein